MPIRSILPDWMILERELRRFRITQVATKRPRKTQSYADRLLERAAAKRMAEIAQARR